MTLHNRCVIMLLLPLLLFAASCASRGPLETLPALERQWPTQERIFRHAVRIEFPKGLPAFSFDGLMRLCATAAGPEIRVVCLTALGLTLCDMTITPTGYRTDVLHPSLAKVPRAAEHIALCVGAIWFAALPVTEQEKGAIQRKTYGRTLLEHLKEPDGRRYVRARGPDAFWTVAYMPGEPHPPQIEFRNEREGYTVRIRFVAGK